MTLSLHDPDFVFTLLVALFMVTFLAIINILNYRIERRQRQEYEQLKSQVEGKG